MRIASAFGLLGLVCLLSSPSRAAGDVFAVMPTQGMGGVTAEAELVGRMMRLALQEQSIAQVPAGTIDASVAANQAACVQSSVACGRLVGEQAGATRAVISELWDQAGTLELRLAVIDIRAAVDPSWQNTTVADSAALGEVAKRSVLALVSPSSFMGQVSIKMAAGAEILVDGVAKDRTPLVAPLRLPVGRHEIEVRYGTATPWRSTVEVDLNSASSLQLCEKGGAIVDDCAATTDPGGGPSLMFIGGSVAAGVGVVALVAGGLLVSGSNTAFEGFRDATSTADANAAAVENVLLQRNLATACFIAGGALVAIGGGSAVASMVME